MRNVSEKLRKRTLAARDTESATVKRKRTLPPAVSQDAPGEDSNSMQ